MPRPSLDLSRRFDRLPRTVRAVARDFSENRTIRLGAGLAYYGLFALAPLLTLSMALAFVVFEDAEVNDYLTGLITDVIGTGHLGAAEDIVAQLSAATESFDLGLVGAGTLVFTASFVFVAVEDAFGAIWDEPVRRGLRNYLLRRLRAFVVVLASALLVLGGLVLQSIANIVETIVPGRFEATNAALSAGGTLASVLALALALTLLYHELGPADLPWRPAMVGGSAAAVAMTIGSFALAAYFSVIGQRSVTGAAAGVLIALLWIYYQAQILLVGAHLVRVLVGAAHPACSQPAAARHLDSDHET